VQQSARESLGKFALFLLCVVLLALCIGTVLARLPMATAQRFAMPLCLAAAFIGYLAAIRPGWLYRVLVNGNKDRK